MLMPYDTSRLAHSKLLCESGITGGKSHSASIPKIRKPGFHSSDTPVTFLFFSLSSLLFSLFDLVCTQQPSPKRLFVQSSFDAFFFFIRIAQNPYSIPKSSGPNSAFPPSESSPYHTTPHYMHSAYHAQTIRTTCLLLAHHADPQGQQSRRVPRNLKVNPLAVRWTPVRALRFLKSKFSLPCLRIGRRKGRKGGGGSAGYSASSNCFHSITQLLNTTTSSHYNHQSRRSMPMVTYIQ